MRDATPEELVDFTLGTIIGGVDANMGIDSFVMTLFQPAILSGDVSPAYVQVVIENLRKRHQEAIEWAQGC